MLCPYCGHFSTTDTTVCGSCGKLLPRQDTVYTGVQAIRQGRRAREAAIHGQEPPRLQHQGEERVYEDPSVRRQQGSEPIYAAP